MDPNTADRDTFSDNLDNQAKEWLAWKLDARTPRKMDRVWLDTGAGETDGVSQWSEKDNPGKSRGLGKTLPWLGLAVVLIFLVWLLGSTVFKLF